MKKILFILCVALTTLCSCSKEDVINEIKSPLMEYEINEINGDVKGYNCNIVLPLGADYNVTSSSDWVNACIIMDFNNKKTNAIRVNVNYNTSTISRSTFITITDVTNNYSINVRINQNGGYFFEINKESFDLKYDDFEFNVYLKTNIETIININCDWIKIIENKEGYLLFSVSENNSNEDRYTKIDFIDTNDESIIKSINIKQNKNPNKQDVPNTNEEKEDIICGYSWSGINVGGYIQGIYSVSCTNKMKNDIEIISFELYKNDTLNSKADDLPKTVKPGESISYSFNYKGYGDSLYVIWKIKLNGENIEKRVNLN